MMESELGPVLRAKYRRELNQTFLTLADPEFYEEDYQMRMLRENQIEGLLPVIGRGIDETGLYEYDISGKSSIKSRYGRSKMTGQDMKGFLNRLSEVTFKVTEYLLDVNCLILEPDYIFCEEEAYYFCYFPGRKCDIWSAFHVLTEYFIRQTDYQDEDSIKMAFMLHRETMEENYSLKKMMETIRRQEKKSSEKEWNEEEQEEQDVVSNYSAPETDWAGEQEIGARIMKETDNLWMPVKQFLRKHKKPKWGDWDGLYIEEEDL